MTGQRSNSGARLRAKWAIPAAEVKYHHAGTWFMPLKRFPGALCDPNGYVLFPTKAAYESSPYLRIGARLNVLGVIARVPGYVRMG